MFIDTHAHLFNEYYDDVKSVINNAKTNKVTHVFTSGVDGKTNRELLENCQDIPEVFITLGLHPEYAETYNEKDLEYIENNLKHAKVIAIGEIGLDYHYESYNKEKQITLFRKQLKIAEKHHMPVVVHSREATADTINILKDYNVKGVIHSFSGSKETALIYANMGYKLGINGVVTFKNAHLKEVIKEIGLEHFILETDSPYLTPVPYRGKENNPGHILDIAEFISNYLNISLQDVAIITDANVKAIFDKFM